jgi:mRNA interferase MazF
LKGSKLRPAVILIKTSLDVTVCFITSQVGWQESTDVMLNPSPTNGVRKQSLIRTGKIATIDKSLVKGLLGNLDNKEIQELNQKLKLLLEL